jgi:hypothetical protein
MITEEMQKLIRKMEYSPDGKWDKNIYLLCKQCYYKKELSSSQLFIICNLDEERKILFFEYMCICYKNEKDLF